MSFSFEGQGQWSRVCGSSLPHQWESRASLCKLLTIYTTFLYALILLCFCLSFLPVSVGEKNTLTEANSGRKGFFQFTGPGYSPSEWGSHSDSGLRELVMSHP